MTTEFIAEEGPLRGLVLALENGDEWIIGRDPDLSNLIIEDPRASRKHVSCKRTEDGFEIENLSETNPILINEHPVSGPTFLQDRDLVKIGSNEFRFYLNGKEQTSIAEPDKLQDLPSIEENYDTIFQEEEALQEVHFDIPPSRYFIKVITGPNSGGEFGLDYDKTYIIGTDTATCDIVFHDLSISRQHAGLTLSSDGTIILEDKGSRNGVIVDRERIEGKTVVSPNSIITLGTSSFFVVDREAPRQTIVAPFIESEKIQEPIIEGLSDTIQTTSLEEEEKKATAAFPEKVSEKAKPTVSMAGLLLIVILAAIAILLGIGMISLFKGGKEIVQPQRDYTQEIQNALRNYPAVRFTYNKNTGRLFLLGHVISGVQKSELLYNLQGLNFINSMDDNIVVDEYVWQEMNILLAKNSDWRGISMQSPEPGKFVLTGYLKTNKEAAALTDYVNLNFNYLDRLQNRVVVEEQLLGEVTSGLMQRGFNGVTPAINNGELTLTGYISSTQNAEFQYLVQGFGQIYGIRAVRNYVVSLSPEQAIVDLSNRYKVTGYSKHGDVNINVVINGRLLTRGDKLDGMTVMSIQPHTIFLEKDGLKYKIEYNN